MKLDQINLETILVILYPLQKYASQACQICPLGHNFEYISVNYVKS